MITTKEKTSDYLSTEELRKLNKHFLKIENYTMALLIEFGFRTLLRYSDLERFKWDDIVNKDEISLNERKTNKRRRIKIGGVLKELISNYYEMAGKPSIESKVFHYTLRLLLWTLRSVDIPLSLAALNKAIK